MIQLTLIFLAGKIFGVKRLLKILSVNRKFITAFVGLYAAYTIGYGHGMSEVKNNPSQFSLVADQKQVANVSAVTSGDIAVEGSVNSTPGTSSVTTTGTNEASTSLDSKITSATSSEATSQTSVQGSVNTASSSAASAKSSPTPSPSSKPSSSTSPTVTAKTIDASGKYSYMGQNISYDLSFKNTGGAVSGTVGGACSGKVDGNFDGNSEGIVYGTVKGSCGVGFISKKLDATYKGVVYLNRGIVNITLHGEIPFVEGDQSFSLSFNP